VFLIKNVEECHRRSVQKNYLEPGYNFIFLTSIERFGSQQNE
jgi:hypothetical protein